MITNDRLAIRGELCCAHTQQQIIFNLLQYGIDRIIIGVKCTTADTGGGQAD